MSRIKNRDHMVTDFGSFNFTDLDFVFEWRDRFLLIGEHKRTGAKMKMSQRLAIERICAKYADSEGSRGIGLFVTSDTSNLEDAVVREVYDARVSRWVAVEESFTWYIQTLEEIHDVNMTLGRGSVI